VDLSSRLEPVLAVASETAHDVDAYAQIPAKAVDALRTSGLFGLTLSEEVGGLGGGPAELVTAVTGLASACGSTAMIYLMHVAAAMTVAAAPPAEPADLLHTMASGERLGTLAFPKLVPGPTSGHRSPRPYATTAGSGSMSPRVG
jgi:alkylation response protein AidB-like acyl-CoA dehydrogenase